MYNLTKTIAVASLLASASAYSLGIGDIKLHSALNQNLDAEIALLISANENVSDFQVRLASPEKFDQAGIPWSYFLAKITFESITKADGSTIVKVSSKEPIKELFLDFLLEVSWDKGILYREFTVLLDPPAAYTRPVIPSIQKVKPVIDKQEEAVTVETATENVVLDAKYGPINKADNLWKIAEQVGIYNDISRQQMIVAIYKTNPKAFYKDNVNALKVGQTLNIPEKEIIIRLSKKDAIVEFKRQNNVWNGRVTDKAQDVLAISEATEIETQPDLRPPVEDVIFDNVEVADPDVSTNGTSGHRQGVVSQASLDELEYKLALKDKEIAALMNQIKKSKIVATVVESTVEATVEEAKIATKATAVKAKVIETAKVTEEEEVAEIGLMSDINLIIGGIIFVILGILGLFFLRKRKTKEQTENDFVDNSEPHDESGAFELDIDAPTLPSD